MKWTTPADIKAQLERRWARGDVCRAAVEDANASELFPFRLVLRQPSAKTMLDEFASMQTWVKSMQAYAAQKKLTLEWQQINHRTLGKQHLPCRLLLDDPHQAASVIGKAQALKLFCRLYKETGKQVDRLQVWMLKYPIKVLELAEQWHMLLALCVWMQTHPNPRIYVRQVDVAGVDSKFIEQHKRVLADLFALVLPVYAINDDYSGAAGFARRYGFLDKPAMLRMRPLDADISLLWSSGNHDVVMTEQAFSRLHASVLKQVNRVVIVENEINYLAFPDMDHSLLIFGSGYGFEALKQAQWLHQCALYYWGDLDTHGFAILNQLRSSFPHAQSFLMDKDTMMSHQHAWGVEPKQERKDLTCLNQDEASLYDDLRHNRWSDSLRLEQEHIAFSRVILAVEEIAATGKLS